MDFRVMEEMVRESALARELWREAGAVIALVAREATSIVVLGEGVAAHTAMQVGSVTKGFTGLLLADAMQRGEVRLESRVDEVLFGERWDGVDAVSALLLATHRSGLPRLELPLMQRIDPDPYRKYGREDLLRSIAKSKPRVPQELKYEYSNYGYAVLGLMLEKASGQTYTELLEERMLRRLGMDATHVQLPDGREWVQPGFKKDGKRTPVWHLDAYAPCGAMVSTLEDMLKAVQAFLDPNSVVARTLEVAIAPQAKIPGGSVGLAWHMPEGGEWFWHNGATFGHTSYFGVSRQSGVGTVVLVNQFLPGQVTQLGHALMRELSKAE